MPRKILQTNFFNYGPKPSPVKLTVRQKFGNHTAVHLDYEISRLVEYVLPPEGTPVSVLWGVSPTKLKTFYGYNNHYETTLDRTDKATTRLTLLGTSKTMNTTQPTNWFGVTRSGVAREIAKRHRLRSVIHPHDAVLENWTTGIRSDFQALRRLADETGYRLWVDGATLYFLDPQRLLVSAQRQDIPFISGMDIRSAQITGGAGAPVEGGVNTRKMAYGLDYRNNELFVATRGTSAYPDQILPVTASTYTEADTWLEAADRVSSAYFTAEVSLTGNSFIEPGSLIQLGDSPTVNDLGGFWAVTAVRHELDRRDFVSHVTAIRYADKTPDILTTSTIKGTSDSVSMVVRDGRNWEATIQEHVNV